MANKEYYERWLKIKEEFQQALAEDERLQEYAIGYIGLKPQCNAVEIVARVYCKYCNLYNRLCDCYDQMEQVQRRPFIKQIIDAITCRILELKKILEEVEVYEFTYTDNACQQMLIKPQDVDILCPFFYPFEIRQAEYQYIMDQIFAGNRIGDITPTASELEQREEAKREEEERIREEKEAEIKRLLTLGMDLPEPSIEYSPEELEEMRLKQEYDDNINNIQRMERSRTVCKAKFKKQHKDADLYLELAGLKKPQAKEALRIKAAGMLKTLCRRFMEAKREKNREYKLREKLQMIIPSQKQKSAKEQLEKVKEARRQFRRAYYEQWLARNITEKTKVLQFRKDDLMDDISDEIRQWWCEWFDRVRVFDEFPYPNEGGSILIVSGETFQIDEYIEWKDAEEKRIKAEAGAKKTAEQIKAEKLFAREEKRRLAAEAKEKEKKRIIDYMKQRMNPDNDPGVFLKIGQKLEALQDAWQNYEVQWRTIDEPDADLDVIRGMIKELITEDAYRTVQLELRPIVDDIMRLELAILTQALKRDYASAGLPLPLIKKRKKGKKPGKPKADKEPARVMFQRLADQGIVRTYPHIKLDDFLGDRNYAAADSRAIPWKPVFPPHCLGDLREQVKIRCLLTLGAACPNICRSQLIVGPKCSGKKSLIYAVATETNTLLIDLSPLKVYNKFPGPKDTKQMWLYINKISKIMQPTIILVENADKMFYKAVPKEEKEFNPTRLSKDFFKQIIKGIGPKDRVMVLGTASEPWLAKSPTMFKVFPETIVIPRTDYASISFILKKMLMEYHGVDREFNVHSVAQVVRGYNIEAIKTAVRTLLKGNRMMELKYKPLQPMELLDSILTNPCAVYTDEFDYEMYNNWYLSYSPVGPKIAYNQAMLTSQLIYKEKADKKKKAG